MAAAVWASGKEFYKKAGKKLINEHAFCMESLIALGTISAVLCLQFLPALMILTIINVGQGIKAYIRAKTKNKVQSLNNVYVKLQPQNAKKLTLSYSLDIFDRPDLDEHIKEINYLDIKEGDIIQVKAHERIPVDGKIINDAETFVHQETLTGESQPYNRIKGDDVFAGSLNKNTIYIRASKDGDQSQLKKILDDVARSSETKPSISKLVDKLASFFVPTIIVLALVTAAGWFFLGPLPVLPWVIKSTLSVLLCACPCALGLATPIASTFGIYGSLKNGILVHDAAALESMAIVNTIVFDKTDTLTTPVVHEVFIGSEIWEWDRHTILQYAASLEHGCPNHPIGKAIVSENSSTELLSCKNVKKDGQGVSGEVDGVDVLIGNLTHLESRGIKVAEQYKKLEDENAHAGMTSVYVAINKECVAVIGLKQKIRDDAKKAIEDLKKMNIDVFMLTGDKKAPAEAVAEALGISKVYAEHSADMKEAFILGLTKTKKRRVAMVGDGLNDTKATKAAHVGIALGSWTDVAASSDIALQKLNIAALIIIARKTMRNIHQNLVWTGLYNLFSITMAMGFLYPVFGFMLNPVVASLAMAASSIIVVVNSNRLPYQIDYAVGQQEGKIQQPKTFFEKLQQVLSLNSLAQALKFKHEEPMELNKVKQPEVQKLKVMKSEVKPQTPAFNNFCSERNDERSDSDIIVGIKPGRTRI